MTGPTSYRVLIVDDEREIRELTRRAITRCGLECEVAEDGREAWEQLQRGEFDAIVTDLRMPNQNGHTLCVDVMDLPRRPVVIVLTGVAEPKLARDLRIRGVDDIQYKPVNYANFAARVRQLIEARAEKSTERDPFTLPNKNEDKIPPDEMDGKSICGSSNGKTGPRGRSTRADSRVCRHFVAVLLADRSRAQRVADHLAGRNVGAEAMCGVDDLNDRLRAQSVDLLVLENELPGFLTGWEIVEKSRGLPGSPDVILLTGSGEIAGETITKSKVQCLLPSGESDETVVQNVLAVLKRLSARDDCIPRRARDLVQHSPDVAPLPELLLRLLSYLQVDVNELSIEKLAGDIAADSTLAAQLLKVTNSASTGLRRKVEDVRDAVGLHGPRRAVSLLLSSAVLSAQQEMMQPAAKEFRRWYTQRSVLLASTAWTFAERFETLCAESAFLLGLLQDAGILLLERGAPKCYRALRQRMSENGRAELTILEFEEFRITHADVSAALMERWGMPRSFIAPVLAHHDAARGSKLSARNQAFVRVMQIGELLANVSLLDHPARMQRLNASLAVYGKADPDACRACVKDAIAKASASCRLFSVEEPDATLWEHLN